MFFLPASSFSDKQGIETAKLALEHGFDGIELWGDGLVLLSESEIEEAYRFFKDNPLKLSVHLPYLDINIASANPDIRRVSLELSTRALITARRIGARFAVVHTGKPTGTKSVDFSHINISSSEDSIYRLLQVASITGSTLLIENGVKKELFSRLDSFIAFVRKFPTAGICLDVGHAHTMRWNFDGMKNAYDVVERIKYIHAHDNNGKYDEHKPIGYGTVKWEKIVSFLKGRIILLEIREFNDIKDFVESREKILSLLSYFNE